MESIWAEDFYAVLTRIIPLYVHDLHRPIANENLHPALVNLLYHHFVFLQSEHTHGFSPLQLFLEFHLMAAGIIHHLDIHSSSQGSFACAVAAVAADNTLGLSSRKER